MLTHLATSHHDDFQVETRPGAETFVAGLPMGLRALPEADYIQMHDASRWRLQRQGVSLLAVRKIE